MPRRTLWIRSVVLLLATAALATAVAAPAEAAEEYTRGLRYPALSPDGKLITFAYRGDIWVAPTDGKSAARRLTIHEAQDTLPRISPDGTQIAFSSQRNGAYDIYVMPVMGGEARRISFHSGAEVVCDWSPDGKRILFASARDPSIYRLNLYEMSATGGPARRITVDGGRDGSYAPDGKSIVYARGFNTIYQDNYTGSANYDLYHVPVSGGTPTRLTQTDGNERYPFLSEDGKTVFFLAEEKGVANVYAMPAAGGDRRRVTEYKDLDIHRPDLGFDFKTLAFERGGQLFHADLTEASPKAVPYPLHVKGDVRHSGVTQRTVTSGAVQVHLSKDGSRLVFSLHGDIWMTSGSGGNAKRLTTTKIKEEWPRFSPDGTQVAFQAEKNDNTDIFLLDLKSGGIRQLTSHPKGDFFHSWSPDGRQLVFSSERSGNRDIWTLDLESGTFKQLTKHKAADDDPVWSPDGNYIAFDSGREGSQAIYIMDADGGNVRRVTNGGGFLQVPNWSPDGQLLCYEAFNPASGRSDGLYVISAAGGPNMQVSRDGQASCWSPRGDYIYFSVGDEGRQEIFRVPAPQSIENRERVPFLGAVEVDLRAELADLFDEAWTRLKEGFYDAKMHGVDWNKMKSKYRGMAVDAEDKAEFHNVINQMLAELNASHLGIYGGRRHTQAVSAQTVPTGYLGADLANEPTKDGGRKITSVFPKGPADAAGLRVGDELLAINRKTIKADTDLDQLLAGTVGKEIRVRFRPIAESGYGDPREETLKPIDAETLYKMQYVRRVTGNARTVGKATKGQVGYIHLRAMDPANLNSFQRAVSNWNRSKRIQGMILDVRENGGGNIHQQLMQILTARPFAQVQVRGSPAKVTQPALYWDKPVVLLINERSFSDAEVFPFIFKAMKVGKVIGVPTPGGVIGTNDITLSDGTRFRIPRVGYYGMDGTNLEGLGVQPDIVVQETAEDRLQGRDPQLAKAIEVVTSDIKARKAAAKPTAAKPTTPEGAKPTPPKPDDQPTPPKPGAEPTPPTPTPPQPPRKPDATQRRAGALDPLFDAVAGEWVRFVAALPGSPEKTTMVVRLVSIKEGTLYFEREVESGPPLPLPLPNEAPQVPLLDGLASMGRVVNQETRTEDVKGQRVEVAVVTIEAFGGQLEMHFSNAVPGLGLLRVRMGKAVVLEAVDWGIDAIEETPPEPPTQQPVADEAVPGPEAEADAADAPPNPLGDAKVGEWIRLRSIVQGEETIATLRVVEVTEDEVHLESRVAHAGTEIRGAVIKRSRRQPLGAVGRRGRGGTVAFGRETLEVKGRALACITVTRTNRRGQVDKRWICPEVPVSGLVRQERAGTVVKELLDWGTGEPPAIGPATR